MVKKKEIWKLIFLVASLMKLLLPPLRRLSLSRQLSLNPQLLQLMLLLQMLKTTHRLRLPLNQPTSRFSRQQQP